MIELLPRFLAALMLLSAMSPAFAQTPPTKSVGTQTVPEMQIIPEYAPTEALVLPGALFLANYHADELVRAILAADANVLIAARDEDERKSLLPKVKNLNASTPTQKTPAPPSRRSVQILQIPYDDMWLRDFGPFFVQQTRRGDSPNLAAVSLRFDGLSGVNEQFSAQLARHLSLKHQQLPFFLDGGNLVIAGQHCLSADADLFPKDLAQRLDPIKLAQLGVQALRSPEARPLGCSQHDILPTPPHEHIDMWVKAVNDDTVLVSEIDNTTVSYLRKQGKVPDEILALKANLDTQAKRLQDLSTSTSQLSPKDSSKRLQVLRIPLPLPFRSGFRTYANALLVNGTAIVPSYSHYGWGYGEYPDATLKTYYENKVTSVYKTLGFDVRLVNADGLIFNGGAFHCVAVQIPRKTD